MVFTEIELLLIHLPMSWWLWIILGFVILCMELFAPSGFFLFFIGLSGVLTGIVVATGVITQAWAEWVLCGAIIVGLLVSLRRPLMGKFYGPGKERASPVEGDEVIILEAIKAGQIGKGELRGAAWQVKNVGAVDLSAGERYPVQKVVGLTLQVSKI